MNTFDRKFRKTISGADGVPEGFDTRVEARLKSLPERETETAHGQTVWTGRRRAMAALAAVLAVCLISGTALAVSPTLRELLWGGFEPYVQNLEPTAENTHVYDNVEARIVSALSDGYANILEIQLRDLEGDRVREAWERYRETGVNEFRDAVRFTRVLETDSLREESLAASGSFSMGSAAAELTARPVSFDGESGVLTLKTSLFTAAPAGIDRVAQVEIDTGLAGTKARLEHHISDASWNQKTLVDGVVVAEESGQGDEWDTPVVGWSLTAPLACLPVRDIALDRVRVDASQVYLSDEADDNAPVDPAMLLTSAHISQMGVTLCREPDEMSATRVAPDELTVRFRDGTSETLSGLWESHFYCRFEINGDSVNTDTWLFPSPVDPESIVSITLGGVEITVA